MNNLKLNFYTVNPAILPIIPKEWVIQSFDYGEWLRSIASCQDEDFNCRDFPNTFGPLIAASVCGTDDTVRTNMHKDELWCDVRDPNGKTHEFYKDYFFNNFDLEVKDCLQHKQLFFDFDAVEHFNRESDCVSDTGSDFDIDIDNYINTEAANDRPVDFNNSVVQGKSVMDAADGGKYDNSGNSSHYQSNFMEYVREQERKYGTVVAYLACQTQVDRYNQRVGTKVGVPAEKDLVKRDWYKTVGLYFKDKIETYRSAWEEGTDNGRTEVYESIIESSLFQSYVTCSEEVLDLLMPEYSFIDTSSTERLYTKLSDIHKNYK